MLGRYRLRLTRVFDGRLASRFAADSEVRFVMGAGDVISKDHQFLRHIPALPMIDITIFN